MDFVNNSHYRRVKIIYIKFYKWATSIFNGFKPCNYCLLVWPLVDVRCFSNITIYFFNIAFTNDANLSSSQLKKRNRKRQIIWFNPPYSVNEKTNVGKLFMRLIDKQFPSHHKFHKLFSRNNIKLSYSCMPSMKNVIQKHNSKIMEDPKPTNNKTCSCQQKSDCPLNRNCPSECLVYNAAVNTSTTKNYYGTCVKRFKERYNNPTSSFKNKSRQKSKEVSSCIWELKENRKNYTTDWLISVKVHLYICGTRKCDLCLSDKLMIAKANSASLLNKRDELVSKCRHMNKFTLKCFKNR